MAFNSNWSPQANRQLLEIGEQLDAAASPPGPHQSAHTALQEMPFSVSITSAARRPPRLKARVYDPAAFALLCAGATRYKAPGGPS